VSAGGPVWALAIDPAAPTTLYAGTDAGVFRSLNGGHSWSPVNTGLPDDANVLALAIDPTTPTTLYAGTYGGMFRSLNGGSSWQATGLGAEPICGDAIVRCGEECDDGGESATCDIDCTLPQCGDATLNLTAGEQCDDGNRNPSDGCTNDCTVCGDGVVAPPEECDDGNTSGGDDCDAQCRRPRVVGTGTPQSCTEAAFDPALAQGSVTFNCGPAPVTITLTSEKIITAGTTIDGGGLITLSGGGAVRIFTVDLGAALNVRNLTIADGRGDTDFGGGILNLGGTLTLTNCTLSGNSATAGGGIYYGSFSSPPIGGIRVIESTGDIGGGIYTMTLTNTIVANSLSGGDCVTLIPAGLNDGGHNLFEDATNSCGLTNGVNGNLVGVEPLLGPLTNNGGPTETIALLPGSPAINAGDPDVCANPPVNGVDQRGYARAGSGHTQCSIGAYEADAFLAESCVGDCGGTASVTVNEIITLVNIALGNTQPSACPHGVPSGADVDVALIIEAVNHALNGCGVCPAEQGCLTSAGTVTSATCCASTGDFPDTCAIGACGCAPGASQSVRVCECAAGSCFEGSGCVRQ